MGCDIHLKTFVHSKVENKMVPAMGAFEDSEYFPQIVGDRDYDLFGLFGNSARSYYPELGCLHDGFPDFMKDTTVYKLASNSDFHTIKWCDADELKTELLEYKERLLDPRKWNDHYDDEDDFVLDTINGKVSIETYRKWHEGLVASIDEVVEKIGDVKQWMDDYPEYLDSSRIVFVTWMDS